MHSVKHKNIVIGMCAFGILLIAANYTYLIAIGREISFGLFTIIAFILAGGGLYTYTLPIKPIIGSSSKIIAQTGVSMPEEEDGLEDVLDPERDDGVDYLDDII